MPRRFVAYRRCLSTYAQNRLSVLNAYYGVQEGHLLQIVSIDAGEYVRHLLDLLTVQSRLLASLSLSVELEVDGPFVTALFEQDREIGFRRINRWVPLENTQIPEMYLQCANALEGQGKSLVRICLSAAIARVIRERVAVDYMLALLSRIGPVFSQDERAVMLDDAVRLTYAGELREEYVLSSDPEAEPNLWACLSCTELEPVPGTVFKVDYVFLRVFEHLCTSNQISVEGFVRFRLRDYLSRLRAAVYRAIDGYLLDQQHTEFVDLLRYFVEVQEPRIESVTVVRRSDGRLELLDETGRAINTEGLLESIDDLLDDDFNVEDLLIGLLIAIAPSRVLICMRGGQLLFDTTMRVFRDRILVCDGCSSCQLYKP